MGAQDQIIINQRIRAAIENLESEIQKKPDNVDFLEAFKLELESIIEKVYST